MNSSTSFTFLATLFIVLLISSSIVFRSCILRRRFRQRYERALAHGRLNSLDGATLAGLDNLDGFGPGHSDRLGAKPVLWETSVQRTNSYGDDKQSQSPHQTNPWSRIMPVALHITRSSSSPNPLSPRSSSPDTRQQQQRQPTLLSRLRFPDLFSRSSQPSLSPRGARNDTEPVPGPSRSGSSNSKDTDASVDLNTNTLSICVLIAMPNVSAPVHRSSMYTSTNVSPPATEEGGCPIIEFGAVELRAVGVDGEVS
jgi:hypothetical protein